MNKKQLKSFIDSYLSRSPNRRVEIAQAIEERLRKGQGKRQSGSDALDDWIASCLHIDASLPAAELEIRIAEILDQLVDKNDDVAKNLKPPRKTEYRAPRNTKTTLPFSDIEIREQARSVIRMISESGATDDRQKD